MSNTGFCIALLGSAGMPGPGGRCRHGRDAALQQGRQKHPCALSTVEINYCCLNIFLLLCVTGQEINSKYCFTAPYHLQPPDKRQGYKNHRGLQKKKKKEKNQTKVRPCKVPLSILSQNKQIIIIKKKLKMFCQHP